VATIDPPPADPSQFGASRPAKPRIVERLEAQRDRHRRRPLVVRVLYVLVGFAVLLSGFAMLLLPGPAFVVIPVGLALLSLEFAWAEGLLERVLAQGEIARRRAGATTTLQRLVTGICATLAAIGLAAWAVVGDIPLVPV
jgi:uncharacterized protein (TIGR02611 family)